MTGVQTCALPICFIIIGVNPYWQMIAVGVVLVIAVALDQWRRRAQNRR